MSIRHLATALCGGLAIAALSACGAHGQGSTVPVLPQSRYVRPMDTLGGIGNSFTRMNVTLGDAAPSLNGKHVNAVDLGVLEIDAIKNGRTTVLASYDQPKVVDVLAHQDDAGETIANNAAAGTSYDALRLVVDVASSNVAFGRGQHTLPIDFLINTSTSSSAGAGVNTTTVADGAGAVDMIVTQPFTIPADGHQSVRLDFNAFESLALPQGNDLVSRPVLFVAPVDDLGVIRGSVATSQGDAVKGATVVAVAADGTIGNTGFSDRYGRFAIGTLRSGTYHLLIYNTYTNASGAQFNASAASQLNSQQVVSGPTVTVNSGRTAKTGTLTD